MSLSTMPGRTEFAETGHRQVVVFQKQSLKISFDSNCSVTVSKRVHMTPEHCYQLKWEIQFGPEETISGTCPMSYGDFLYAFGLQPTALHSCRQVDSLQGMMYVPGIMHTHVRGLPICIKLDDEIMEAARQLI